MLQGVSFLQNLITWVFFFLITFPVSDFGSLDVFARVVDFVVAAADPLTPTYVFIDAVLFFLEPPLCWSDIFISIFIQQ